MLKTVLVKEPVHKYQIFKYSTWNSTAGYGAGAQVAGILSLCSCLQLLPPSRHRKLGKSHQARYLVNPAKDQQVEQGIKLNRFQTDTEFRSQVAVHSKLDQPLIGQDQVLFINYLLTPGWQKLAGYWWLQKIAFNFFDGWVHANLQQKPVILRLLSYSNKRSFCGREEKYEKS